MAIARSSSSHRVARDRVNHHFTVRRQIPRATPLRRDTQVSNKYYRNRSR